MQRLDLHAQQSITNAYRQHSTDGNEILMAVGRWMIEEPLAVTGSRWEDPQSFGEEIMSLVAREKQHRMEEEFLLYVSPLEENEAVFADDG